jgi:hypothetical protein
MTKHPIALELRTAPLAHAGFATTRFGHPQGTTRPEQALSCS